MACETLVTIHSMAFKGYGVSRVNGKVLFIPHTIKGEEAQVEITEEKKTYSLGKVRHLLRPSPWRVDPPCPYFGQCGGCHWQHIDPALQVEFKKEILQDTLTRLGGLERVPPIAVTPSPQPYHYRLRVQLKVQGEAIGYYEERSHRLVAIEHCAIAHPLVNRILTALRQSLPLFRSLEEIEINVSPEEEQGTLRLHSRRFSPDTEHLLPEFQSKHPVLKGMILAGGKRVKRFGDPVLYFTISFRRHNEDRSLRLRTSPESFFQVHLEQNQRLIQAVHEWADVQPQERVLDLYSGVGNFTLPLAVGAKEAWGIEENPRAVEDARFNADQNGIPSCTFIQGKVEDVLKTLAAKRFEVVVLDPPRTGCKRIVNQITQLEPKRIIYVSCEPTTLARDLRLFLERGYRLEDLRLLDLFPQSYHMEVVALLRSPC